MELDEMKMAWANLDQRMDQQLAMTRKMFRDTELTKARKGLRPLFFGQIIQMLFGILMIILGATSWSNHLGSLQQMIPGWILHIYGILTVILSGITLGKISGISYSAPVAIIQKQLAELRYFYLITSMILGLIWWLLWIPFMAAIFGLLGANMMERAPGMIYLSTAIGVLGLIGTWLFHKWAHHPKRSEFGKKLDDAAAGSSLKNANRILEEIRRFEVE